MADLTKHEILLNELSAIEAQLSILVHRNKELLGNIERQEVELLRLRDDNSVLQQKVVMLETETKVPQNDGDNNLFNSLNLKERENLKVKLQHLLSKIDYHLSS
ncbi:MAG: hypothetical protein P4L45_06645 [Ignavibacteriaceae bacterium]|nr:hypothetical protein [Ignavibacteriaceae bacterium]